MSYPVMNDYELVYLIRTQVDTVAFDYLVHKYQKLIWKHIHLLHLCPTEHDDFYQEGILMLQKAVHTFDERKNKTFTRYFELIMRRQFYQLIDRLPKYHLFEDTSFLKFFSYEEDLHTEDFLEKCSSLEQQIYQLHFVEGMSVKRVVAHLQCEPKKIYNALYRLKEKYKSML
ncbi:MAG: sigma-70 family RNA polymerase sigma factor [Acholeplasmataceae bacterium]|nr:sigma-70 family RNA polymerase sigma factor [Acholeplasmataceae bacterium]